MKLQNIGLNNIAKSEAAKKPFILNGLKPLSNTENKMIKENFPINRKLELYLSSGSARTEQPDSRGRNFDIRV